MCRKWLGHQTALENCRARVRDILEFTENHRFRSIQLYSAKTGVVCLRE